MKHRTALVTAASVAVVILAATAAIATNLGILSSGTDTGEVGALTVASTEQSEVPPANLVSIVDEEATEAASDTDPAPAGEITAYAVGDAGVVTLNNDGSMLTIDNVTTNAGWRTAQILDGTSVDVGFATADGQVLRFVAELDETGTIQTLVEDLTPGASRYDDDHDYDDDHRYDDDHDDDDHDDDD